MEMSAISRTLRSQASENLAILHAHDYGKLAIPDVGERKKAISGQDSKRLKTVRPVGTGGTLTKHKHRRPETCQFAIPSDMTGREEKLGSNTANIRDTSLGTKSSPRGYDRLGSRMPHPVVLPAVHGRLRECGMLESRLPFEFVPFCRSSILRRRERCRNPGRPLHFTTFHPPQPALP